MNLTIAAACHAPRCRNAATDILLVVLRNVPVCHDCHELYTNGGGHAADYDALRALALQYPLHATVGP